MKNKAYYRLKNISHSDPIYQACSKNKKETANLENTKKKGRSIQTIARRKRTTK